MKICKGCHFAWHNSDHPGLHVSERLRFDSHHGRLGNLSFSDNPSVSDGLILCSICKEPSLVTYDASPA